MRQEEGEKASQIRKETEEGAGTERKTEGEDNSLQKLARSMDKEMYGILISLKRNDALIYATIHINKH